MGSPASGPRGLAELIVRQTGAAEALRTKDVRDIVLAALDPDEREDLCRVLGHPRGDTARTLKGAQFDRIASHLELLFGWLAVPFETEDLRDEEETRQAPPAHKLNDHQRSAFRDLRRRLDESGSATLLHMPVGAGKLRIVATALVDLYRSEPDGRIVLWLAHDPALCSHPRTADRVRRRQDYENGAGAQSRGDLAPDAVAGADLPFRPHLPLLRC
ncbi:DEAD/DEAH box helicase family protein [Methylorubrum extorquens]